MISNSHFQSWKEDWYRQELLLWIFSILFLFGSYIYSNIYFTPEWDWDTIAMIWLIFVSYIIYTIYIVILLSVNIYFVKFKSLQNVGLDIIIFIVLYLHSPIIPYLLLIFLWSTVFPRTILSLTLIIRNSK